MRYAVRTFVIFSLLLKAMAGLDSVAQVGSPAPLRIQSDAASSAPQGGEATAGVFAPVLDSEMRPITAGGFVKEGPVIFKDITEQAGLSVWRNVMGTPQKNYILETIGSGAALLDYDNDGWLDIYLVNGSTYDAMKGTAEPPHAALFHNNHDGTFTDVAEKAGVTLGNWSTGATFGDYDGDGRLDLFVPGYIHYDIDHQMTSGPKGGGGVFCKFRGVEVLCGPRGLPGEHDHLFHNNGDGTFTDVSVKAGVSDEAGYYGFTAAFVDVNNDGKVDLIVNDDSTPNYLYLNKGDGTFEDISFDSGFALNQNGREQANMGLAIGDYINNGLIDMYTGTSSDDYKPLFRNEGGGSASFTEISPDMGIAEVTYPFFTWATGFIDYDNDGWKDIFLVNGHVYPEVDKNNFGTSFAERPLLFHNINQGKKFDLVPAVIGTGLADVLPGRGAAFGDLFNDGKIDVVINCIDRTPALLRNVDPNAHHWVGLKLIGGPKSPRDAVGSTVYLAANGMRQRADVMSGGSYESSNDQRVHFGIGDAVKVDDVEIHWPSGSIEKVSLPSVDRFFAIEEGKGIVPSVYDSMKPISARSAPLQRAVR